MISLLQVGKKKGESWKWVCSDSNIRPYRNSNLDIFPEPELLLAFRQWVSKPLCVNHQSNSVDAIRGIILDTYYDRKFKRVIGLCALDKVTYPDLANKVKLGYCTCVSMGVGVGRAICSDCGNVARTEQEFCSHMKNKSCYGEINVGLQPIELSIVVNGADPQAKIRTIIAAANTVNNHLAEKENELNKLSHSTNFNADQLKRLSEELEHDLKNANDKLAEIKDYLESPQEVDAAYGMSSGRLNDPTDEIDQSTNLNLPDRFAANNNALLNEVQELKVALEQRLHGIEKGLDNLNRNKEEIMAKDAMNKQGYFQGGGEGNEPTPGQKKYPIDPKNEELRLKDKHMVGESPLPEVGAVDGMHPSPTSADQKDELERKKMLARAERREAALQTAKETIMNQKKAYFHGGGGINEPLPGKVKYDIDPLNEQLRNKEDKQMVGQKPFPDVGKVDGLHPSPLSADEKDELKRKELLQRASLKARFVRVANADGTDNLGGSVWQVYKKDDSGEKLVFTASVDEITNGNSDVLFDVIATKEFGTSMLEKIRKVGLSNASSLYKKAQAVAAPGGMPSGTPDMGGPAAAPAMPEAPMPEAPPVEDKGGKGDPKEAALKLAEELRDKSSDMLELVRELTGEQGQMGEGGLEALPQATASLAPLYKMKKELGVALLSGAKKSLAEIKDHLEEIELIASTVDAGTMSKYSMIVEDAFEDAKKVVADSADLKAAYVKYAEGVVGLQKRAEEVEDMNDARKKAKKPEEKKEVCCKECGCACKVSDCEDTLLADVPEDLTTVDFEEEPELAEVGDKDTEKDAEIAALKEQIADLEGKEPEVLPVDDTNDLKVEVDNNGVFKGVTASFDLTTKEGRTAYRAKLAADATGKLPSGETESVESMKHSDMLDHSEGLADGQTELDVKPSDELGKIENVVEQQKKDLEVARTEPKVRKEAERLNQLISEGKVSEGELDSLVTHGLDAEVVKYWRQFYGQAGKEGSEFAKLLTTETMKAKAEEDMKTYKVKVARAYDLANEMVRRGLLTDDRTSIGAQVDEIMRWNDEAFDSYRRIVARHAPLSMKKEASMPQVGLIGTGDNKPAVDFQSELDAAFSGRKY